MICFNIQSILDTRYSQIIIQKALTAGVLHFSITFDGKKLHFSMINVKTTLLKLWRYYVKYRVLKRHFL